jgi:hypothetical protein
LTQIHSTCPGGVFNPSHQLWTPHWATLHPHPLSQPWTTAPNPRRSMWFSVGQQFSLDPLQQCLPLTGASCAPHHRCISCAAGMTGVLPPHWAYWLRWGLSNFLPRLVSNLKAPSLHLSSVRNNSNHKSYTCSKADARQHLSLQKNVCVSDLNQASQQTHIA